MPFATGQLLHAFVFDRDCFPKVPDYGRSDVVVGLINLGIRGLHPLAYSELRPTSSTQLSIEAALAI